LQIYKTSKRLRPRAGSADLILTAYLLFPLL